MQESGHSECTLEVYTPHVQKILLLDLLLLDLLLLDLLLLDDTLLIRTST